MFDLSSGAWYVGRGMVAAESFGSQVHDPIHYAGEETGKLDQVLERVSTYYDDEVDTAVEALTSIIEPILIIFLAVVVGTIVIAMFLPLVDIINQIGSR